MEGIVIGNGRMEIMLRGSSVQIPKLGSREDPIQCFCVRRGVVMKSQA